jgi:ABC-type nitrate/sulfonate/bicarbonate transport system substrate-binding protein
MFKFMCSVLVCCFAIAGCSSNKQATAEKPFVISLAYSEYPSWSTFGVAEAKGLIDGKEGRMGPLEKNWNTDIVLKLVDYDTSITLYGNSTVDGVCITNNDIPSPAEGRKSVVVCPTSTSAGADACIVVGDGRSDISIDSLKEIQVYGLEKSVSQYAFTRILKKAGKNPLDYTFKNLDPAAAAGALQTGQKGIQAIMVWNPFVLQTLRTNDKASVLFDTRSIPEAVIDCIAFGEDVTKKPGADRAICAVLDAFYRVDAMLLDPVQRDSTLVALGEKFCSLNAQDMALCTEQTKFYSTPEAGITLFQSDKFKNETMPDVIDFCVTHKTIPEARKIGFEDDTQTVNFTTVYLKKYIESKKSK